VAERGGEVVGFLTLGGCRDADVDQETTGEIWGIYIAPGHWRKGTGSLLCRFGEKTLRERGYRVATLWVFAANDQARRFYEAMSFKADGASKTLNPGMPLEAVRYRKHVADANESG
jgi:ribosomal protein S18 acetylase RimI-like enzyme